MDIEMEIIMKKKNKLQIGFITLMCMSLVKVKQRLFI